MWLKGGAEVAFVAASTAVIIFGLAVICVLIGRAIEWAWWAL